MKNTQAKSIKKNWGSLKDHTRQALHETYGLMMHWVEKDLDLIMDRLNGAITSLDDWMKKREQSIHRANVGDNKRKTRRSESHSGAKA